MEGSGAFSIAVQAVAVYFINGILSVYYALASIAPGLISAVCASAVVLLLDSPAQARLNFHPQRWTIPSPSHSKPSMASVFTTAFPPGQSHTYQWLTLIAFTLWFFAQMGMAAPVPWIGAGMWILGLVVLIIAPEHGRVNLLWFVKSGIVVYALLVLFFRLYLGYTSSLAVSEWARWIGTSEVTAQVIGTTRGNLTSLLLWILWFIAPLGYFFLLIQQLLVNPVSGIHPRAGAEEMLRRLRQRS